MQKSGCWTRTRETHYNIIQYFDNMINNNSPFFYEIKIEYEIYMWRTCFRLFQNQNIRDKAEEVSAPYHVLWLP